MQNINILGLRASIRSQASPPFPTTPQTLCVFVLLTSYRGSGSARVEIVEADSGRTVFSSTNRALPPGTDPLQVFGLTFRLNGCVFPEEGLYWVRFVYNETVIAQQALLLR